MNILGFPSHQSFELTTYEVISSAFLTRIMFVMKARRDAIMEAKEYKMVAGRRKRRSKKEKLIDESNWRFEIVKVNEAFQVCIKHYHFIL